MGGAGFDQRVLGEAAAVLRRQLDAGGQWAKLYAAEQIRQLAQLVLVAGGEDHVLLNYTSQGRDMNVARSSYDLPAPATAVSCDSRRSAIPPSARCRSPSSEARDTGVRSAVACTSTKPPSPVITTLASTSAVESSA